MAKRSPAMEQFFRAKQAYPDAILFFRLGDFYEMFYEDAVLASELLDLTLTSRSHDEQGQDVPMAGVPYHAASGYIARLIEQGQRVAICEQMADPSKVKGVVPREVVRVVTPGLVLDPDALDASASNYLASIAADERGCALFVLELSTSDARACTLAGEADALAELVRIAPREILIEGSAEGLATRLPALLPRAALRTVDPKHAAEAERHAHLSSLLDAARALGFGELALRAAAHGLGYAQASQLEHALPITRIAPYDPSDQLQLDETAVRNLELVSTLGGERKGSLLHLLDETRTAPGARLLRRRLLSPLTDVARIRRRHDRVEALFEDPVLRTRIREIAGRIADIERLAGRAALAVGTPRDLGALRDSLAGCEALFRLLTATTNAAGSALGDTLASLAPDDTCADVRESLERALLAEPPLAASTGGIIRDEHDPRVAELRALRENSQSVLLSLEERERAGTGIPSLKIRYTKVFGYYIEISKARLAAVPQHYRRKQTVAGGERFTTEELEQLQAKILNADERLRALEQQLFEALRARVGEQAARLKRLSESIAELDVHANLAEVAQRYDYARPLIDDSRRIELFESRHPIVERVVGAGQFVPNDVTLDPEQARLMLITGPNMAGKSTVMRQVALCVLLAQVGSFVPARRARVGIVDRVYTRVGASDNLAQGQSTFMVEMKETAAILRGATGRSLVVLDEIGRGTSTYDGLAIAWAVAEHLHDAIGCRAMFATHYHELCELPRAHPHAVNFNVAAKEYGHEVVFLHRLIEGGANRSYGVAVAKLAGVPDGVLSRARGLLRQLERGSKAARGLAEPSPQLAIFDEAEPAEVPPAAPAGDSEIAAALRALDLERTTPLEALVALERLKRLLPPRS